VADLVDKRAILLKGGLFVVLAALASGALFARDPSWTTALLLACVLWSAARAYYFAFYVLERYVDPELRYAGLFALVRAIRRRSRTASRALR
jgi:hypothetical protein